MNSRIRELVLQSTIKVNSPSLDSNGEVVCDNWEECVSLEKFAELIIKECAKVLIQHGAYFSGDGEPYHYAASLIEEHFGVEE